MSSPISTQLIETLTTGSSLTTGQAGVWTKDNSADLYSALNLNPLLGTEKNFDEKLEQQVLSAQKPILWTLACDVLGIYYLPPTNITKKTKWRKLNALKKLTSDGNVSDWSNWFSEAIDAGGIGSGGMGYNTNKQKEVFYLVKALKYWFEKSEDERRDILALGPGVSGIQHFLDTVRDSDEADGQSRQIRHGLLSLLFPDYYSSVLSTRNKHQIASVFSQYAHEQLGISTPEDLDAQINNVSNWLSSQKIGDGLFYDPDVRLIWDSAAESAFDDLDQELLEYRKQIVFYGPPGTGKTYSATTLAKDILARHFFKSLGVEALRGGHKKDLELLQKTNIRRLQLHPAYTYEDFVLGLQLGENGQTEYREGYFLKLLNEISEAESAEPYILILDEINRVDLSRVLGELFSALEDRGEEITLVNGNTICVPHNLYIIGTMNLIDHSVEQLDFALRRRFIWFKAPFSGEALLSILQKKWLDQALPKFPIEDVMSDFELLCEAAANLNKAIRSEQELGENYEIGHVLFGDAATFLGLEMQRRKSTPRNYLFSPKEPKDPIKKLWRLSLKPLIEQYLASLDDGNRKRILDTLEKAFRPNKNNA